jgi:hypothetical protein
MHEQMKKPSMKNTWKEERERSCERTSQNLIHRHPSQITSIGLETPLSLDPLHGGQRDGKAEKRRRRK